MTPANRSYTPLEWPRKGLASEGINRRDGYDGIAWSGLPDQFLVGGAREGVDELFPNTRTRLPRDDYRGGFRGLRVVLGPIMDLTVKESIE